MVTWALSLFISIALAAPSQQEYEDPKGKEEMAAKDSSKIQEILNDPDVKDIYKNCKSKPAESPPVPLSDCLFKELQSQGKLDQIKAKYFKKGADKKSVRSDQNSVLSEIRDTKDPAMQKLEDYLSKRLQDALYGEAQEEARKKGKKVVDHYTFYELYQTQLGKNVVTVLSNYMIDVNVQNLNRNPTNNDFSMCEQVDSNEKENTRQQNFTQLKSTPEETSNKFLKCLPYISKICDKTDKTNSKEDKYQNACLTSRAIKDLRQNIIYTDEIIQKIKDGNKGEMAQKGDPDKTLEVYQSNKAAEGKQIDDLTDLSTGELERSGFANSAEADKKEVSECKDPKDPVCDKYLHNKDETEKLAQLADEADLRGKILSEELAQMDDATLKKYLEQEKRTPEEIKAALENRKNFLEGIKKNLDAEREAVITRMKHKIYGRSTEKNPDNQPAPTGGPATLEEKITAISTELSNKAKNYAQLLQFNNIVSGFLAIGDGDKAKDKLNLSSIKRELRDSAKDQDLGVNLDPTAQKNIQKDMEGKKGASGVDSILLKVQDINKTLLKRDTTP